LQLDLAKFGIVIGYLANRFYFKQKLLI